MQLTSLSLALTRAGFLTGFNPLSLFSAGEPGVFFDPSDLSTLFQDSSGTTPVTAVEQPVGLMLDKSRGLVLGPELFTDQAATVINFSGTAGAYNDATRTMSNSAAGGSGGFPRFSFNLGLTDGKRYKVDLTLVGDVAKVANINAGGGGSFIAGSGATRSGIIDATGSTLIIQTSQDAGWSVSIVSFSVRELPGAHASQSTAASRPVLSARVNLLTKTEQFDDAAWVKSQTAVSANTVTAPDGTPTADTITISIDTPDSYVAQPVSLPASTAFVFHIWLLKGTATGATPSVRDASGAIVLAIITPVLQAGVWQRVELSFTTTTSGTYRFWIGRNGVGSTSLWGASLVPADQASLPYQRVNTATDYDSGPAFPRYLKFDGVDDGLVTPTITPGTDKAQVFAGVRKLSDAARGSVIESSVDPGANAGALLVTAPNASSATFGAGLTTGGTPRTQSFAAYAAPFSAVLAQLADGSKNNIQAAQVFRINSAVAASPDIGEMSPGNFLAHPLYIGRRGGTTLPFNGRLYSLAVRFGPTLTTEQITQTEAYVAGKTGVTLPVATFDFITTDAGDQIVTDSGDTVITDTYFV